MFKAESNIDEAPTETVIGRMPKEYEERKINISSRGVRPPNVRDDSLNDYTSKGYANKEILRLRHLIFHFIEWFRPLLSDILSQEVNLAKFEELAIEGVSEVVVSNDELLQEENLAEFEEQPVEGINEIVVSNVPSQEENLSKFEELTMEGVSEIVVRNLPKLEELAVEGVSEIVVYNLPAQGENLEKFEEFTLEGHRSPIKQRVDNLNDHHLTQFKNDNEETLTLEENLAKLEELAQGGIIETATPFTQGGTRESVQQQNQSIIEDTNVCQGDAEGGEGHVQYTNAFDDEIEQIKVDAITSQKHDASLLTNLNAIQSFSTSHVSAKQPLIELVDEEIELEQTAGYKNETLSGSRDTPNEDSGISASMSSLQEEEDSLSNEQRLGLNAEPAFDIAFEAETIVPSSPSRPTIFQAKINIQKVLNWLNENDVKTVRLLGKPGSRTWTASHVMRSVVEFGLFDIVIWVNMTNSGNELMQIADQLKLSSTTKANRKETKRGLRQKISVSLAAKRFLLIIDGVWTYDLNNLDKLGVPPFFSRQENKSSKVLIIGNFQKMSTDRVLYLYKLPFAEAWFLFCDKAGAGVRVAIGSPDIQPLAKALVKSCKGVPMGIALLAGALRSMKEDTRLTLEAKFEKVYNLRIRHRQLAKRISYGMLPSYAMKVCFLYCTLYPDYHHISVKWLITSWMMEGFIQGFDHLEDAYEEGQRILKELIDRYLLFKLDDDHVMIHDGLINREPFIDDERSDILLAKAGLRLTIPGVFNEYDNFKRICLMDGSLQTKYHPTDCPEFPELSTLLLHGNANIGGRLPSEIPDAFFQRMQNLQVLAILHAGMKSLPSSLSNLNKLHVLVLRGCATLENFNNIQCLGNLKMLSLSGAHALKEIPDDFFGIMNDLESLDLSDTQIKQLPSSLSNLGYLRRLILRDCSYLEELPCLEATKNLEVLDLSGASALRKIDHRLLKDKTSLVLLDLSGTMFDRLPSISKLKCIRYLSLRGCSHFDTFPSLEAFNSLQVLDLSGASGLKKFQGISFGINFDLRILDFSGTQVLQLPSLSECHGLRQLFLRDCSNFQTLPTLNSGLEVLDLSGATAFKKFQDKFLPSMLQTLNLSGTQVIHLPAFPRHNHLHQLLVRGCLTIETLPPLENLERLNEIDLSGSTAFKKFQDESFGINLRILNLCGTEVAQLPSLSKCTRLSQLLLRGCFKLEVLPNLGKLAKLQVLDLSGTTAFKQLQDKCFRQKTALQKLDLSRTLIEQLPSLSKSNELSQILLRDCLKLETLPPLVELTRLEVLDLSGSANFMRFPEEFFMQKEGLKKLDLSGTQVKQLSPLFTCTRLSHLLLRGCLKLETLPPLRELKRLEVLDLSCSTAFKRFPDEFFVQKKGLKKLDLSGTQVQQLSPLSKCSGLSVLLLRGCSNLETLPPFEALTRLQVLDLSGATIVGPSLSECGDLRLPLLNESFGTDWGNTMNVTKEDVSKPCIHVTVSSSDIFHSIGKNSHLWEKCFQRFHICLCPLEEQGKEEDIYSQGKKFFFKKTYYTQTRWLPRSTGPSKILKICGFQSFPSSIEGVLNHVELLFLKKNASITRLSDIGAENVKVMKECWIERCDAIKSVFYGDETKENVALGRNLQNPWVSNLSELRCLYEGVVQSESFICLKNLYIDCCPSLITVFASGLELKNLEILHIQFCDEFESVFGEMVLGETALPRLCKLTLWKLSESKSICGGVLPSLQNLKVGGCPKLLTLPLEINRTDYPQVEIEGELEWWEKLKWEDEGIKSQLHFKQL